MASVASLVLAIRKDTQQTETQALLRKVCYRNPKQGIPFHRRGVGKAAGGLGEFLERFGHVFSPAEASSNYGR